MEQASPVCIATGRTFRPTYVQEDWHDINNHEEGHVVLFFMTTDTDPNCVTRYWQDYERDWLNGWLMWSRPNGRVVTYMLFVDGSWWYWKRATDWLSADELAAQFELRF